MLSKDLIDASVRDMMSFKAFQNWINKSRRGEKLSYYRGYIVDPTIQRIAPTNDRVRVDKFRRRSLPACETCPRAPSFKKSTVTWIMNT